MVRLYKTNYCFTTKEGKKHLILKLNVFLYNKRMKKRNSKSILITFLIIGLYSLFSGLSPTTVKITLTSTGQQALIHRRSMIPPFKNIDIVIPDLKQAGISSSSTSKGQTTYRVELEDFKGNRFPVTSYYSSGYEPKAIMKDAINNSIRNRTEYKNTFYNTVSIFFGFIFIFIPVIAFIANKKSKNNTNSKSKSHTTYKTAEKILEEFQIAKDSSISAQQPQPEAETEKYKNINDSIIK